MRYNRTMSTLMIIIYVLSTSSSLVLIKLGTSNGMPISIVENAIKFNLNLPAVIGLILYGVSFPIYIYLVSKFDLGFIIPLAAGFVYILIFTASFLIFKESFTIYKIIAITLIILGVIILQINK